MIKVTRNYLNEKYGLNKNMWDRRSEELLLYLSEFMDITCECVNNRYYYYVNEESMPDQIPPFPRKSNMKQKMKDYEEFTIAALGNDFKPNSKSKVARDAICAFGSEKYGHQSIPSVVRKFVGPVMDEKGEHTDDMIWVNYSDYEPLDEEMLEDLMSMFKLEHLSQLEMMNAFIKEQQGEDISKEQHGYVKVMNNFKEKYGFRPIKVYAWRLKIDAKI